ncbi:endoglucanase A [Prevotella intermedia]|nr:endoglucanase A [Prevotella intermedia]
MEHEYKTAYIKAELIRTRHLDPDIAFVVFLCAICDFSGNEYKYNPVQRVDSFILYEKKQFDASKNSKWQRGRRVVSYLTEVFRAMPNTIGKP